MALTTTCSWTRAIARAADTGRYGKAKDTEMKIEFDKVPIPYACPISSREVRQLLSGCGIPSEKIARVHFGCDWKTTLEARIVTRGKTIELRVNFCLKDGRTRLLSENSAWRETVKYFGGVIDAENRELVWTTKAAKGYAAFLLLHEVAHVFYSEQAQPHGLSKTKSSASEESWCDSYAKAALLKASEQGVEKTMGETEKNGHNPPLHWLAEKDGSQ